MSSGRCGSCSKPALAGKSHCLDHHKEQSNYTYGLDHDLQQKMAGKYDANKASAVKVWIEAVTKRSLTNDLQASLKSGVVLCELINAIWPGSVAKINQGAMPFVQRENVVAYLDAGKKRGLRETDCFVTQDLYEGDNMAQVIDQICALGQLASNKGYKGPQLVISGGAVQVASPTAFVKAPAGPQVALTQQPYTSPPSYSGANAANSGSSANTVPSWQKPAAAAASSPPVAARPAAAAASAAPAGAAFCGACGTKRADANAKFCGNCGGKF